MTQLTCIVKLSIPHIECSLPYRDRGRATTIYACICNISEFNSALRAMWCVPVHVSNHTWCACYQMDPWQRNQSSVEREVGQQKSILDRERDEWWEDELPLDKNWPTLSYFHSCQPPTLIFSYLFCLVLAISLSSFLNPAVTASAKCMWISTVLLQTVYFTLFSAECQTIFYTL